MRILMEDAVALVVDYQEKLVPAVLDGERLINRTQRLLKGLCAMGVPVLISEQYPKGLGSTVEAIRNVAGEAEVVEKMTFSCADNEDFMAKLEAFGRKSVIICGIEAHVCVLQTVIDLLAKGYNVVLVKDCISSRFADDLEVALIRGQQEGAIISSSESILFELTRRAGNDVFKLVSKLVK